MAVKDQPYRYFICPECDPDTEIAPKDFAAHVKDVHGITEKMGTKSLLMHIKRSPRSAYAYEWEIGGKKFLEMRG